MHDVYNKHDGYECNASDERFSGINSAEEHDPGEHDDGLRAWLGLWRHGGYAPASFARARAHMPTAGAVLAEGEHCWVEQLGLSSEAVGRLHGIKRQVSRGSARADGFEAWLAAEGAAELEGLGPDGWVLVLGDRRWDGVLEAMPSPPPFVFGQGARVLLEGPLSSRVAVVGSRRVSDGALAHTRAVSRAIVEAGGVVVSGGALGVDGAAHQGALEAQGRTVVVLAVGLDRLYPRSHRRLFGQVVEQGGALLTPFPLGVGAKRYHFPRRNTLMASMSVATIVIRARARSGSLMTAQDAARMGRMVGVVPGDVGLEETEGSNHLLTVGGYPLVSAASVHPFM
ncbi:MAG: DNA-processing protein DprA, partial [Myxococcota bacterium]